MQPKLAVTLGSTFKKRRTIVLGGVDSRKMLTGLAEAEKEHRLWALAQSLLGSPFSGSLGFFLASRPKSH